MRLFQRYKTNMGPSLAFTRRQARRDGFSPRQNFVGEHNDPQTLISATNRKSPDNDFDKTILLIGIFHTFVVERGFVSLSCLMAVGLPIPKIYGTHFILLSGYKFSMLARV